MPCAAPRVYPSRTQVCLRPIITVPLLALSLLFARGFRCILAREDRTVTETPVWEEIG